ncbi:hypothetical protein, partial [uncultured Akkermansia sp.]|uniref:hypothetical protein n=1 Tax=uncultured Akkermansia sp. TaxID=512294 RepID=UPI002605867A
ATRKIVIATASATTTTRTAVAAAATIKTIFQLLPNGFTQQVKPFFLPENARKDVVLHACNSLRETGRNTAPPYRSPYFSKVPMPAQYRHVAPSPPCPNRQDA